MNSVYRQKVELLLRLIPLVMDEGVFAVHGGSAINLFVNEMPRYSVDIDLTYIPLDDREKSLKEISSHLETMASKAKRMFRGLHVIPNYGTSKLLCEYRGYQVKVEVNQTKRGIVGGELQHLPLCTKAQNEFGMYCEAAIVPMTQLYGGKVAAALSRQHPRDLFDIKHMTIPMTAIREGLIFCLLGSDRPIHESLSPKLIDQRMAMVNQFEGMSDVPFSYTEFEETRERLIREVRDLLTEEDRQFLIGFERAEPVWCGYEFANLKDYPSVKWKSMNLAKLKTKNPDKLKAEAEKLERCLYLD
ncbi:MAG: nucleotidyl transferase AbiEii/AbiGii toxin family protein [Bacteroidales bacterium]|nr:nucleotidyl transferase AbiEii/AbiGii toxin family protein [Bacteroidales bacterium]